MADAERISGGVTWLQTGSPEGLAVELAGPGLVAPRR
jgi:hypothetical protein